MKYLLCSASFNNGEKLREHYTEYHKIDKDNKFFRKPFQPGKKGSIFCKCLRCGDFLSTEDSKIKHDFLKHYDDGQNVPFEDKPVEIKKTGSITSYEISVNKYRDYYNFENAEQVVGDFLRNVRSRFQPKGEVLIKCGFLIENIQPPVQENLRAIVNTRYWTAEPFKTRYFNNDIFYGLRENILKRVIVNGMSGSSWRFRRFIYLNLKSLNLESEIVR